MGIWKWYNLDLDIFFCYFYSMRAGWMGKSLTLSWNSTSDPEMKGHSIIDYTVLEEKQWIVAIILLIFTLSNMTAKAP